ncbi:MAG: hypothetical protein ACRBN8_18425 [Nannocystales bacterium]
MYEAECPPGTQPDPLGRCVATLRVREGGRDADPNDWCEPGFVVGPLGECVPERITVRFTPTTDGWYVACPPGAKPGPIDGCVLDTGNGGADSWSSACPPGSTRGPDDKCVPRFVLGTLGNAVGSMLLDMVTRADAFDTFTTEEFDEMLEAVSIGPVSEPQLALESIAAEFEADISSPTLAVRLLGEPVRGRRACGGTRD